MLVLRGPAHMASTRPDRASACESSASPHAWRDLPVLRSLTVTLCTSAGVWPAWALGRTAQCAPRLILRPSASQIFRIASNASCSVQYVHCSAQHTSLYFSLHAHTDTPQHVNVTLETRRYPPSIHRYRERYRCGSESYAILYTQHGNTQHTVPGVGVCGRPDLGARRSPRGASTHSITAATCSATNRRCDEHLSRARSVGWCLHRTPSDTS